jgi:phosphohistidine swiveling domain-containing protein
MFEKIKNWLNPDSKPPLWAQGIQSILTAQDVVIARLRTQVTKLEEGQALLLKQIDNDALAVANLSGRVIELESASTVQDQSQLPIAVELKVPFKVGDKVRVQNNTGLDDNFDGKTGRITSTKFSDSGTGYVLYSVRFPRKIKDSAIHEFYDDEIELVEE